ncbi:MAG: acyl-CoA thioesterase, partial [Pseudomonadota bacterium]
GNSSVEYGIAIFKKGAELAASAGTFTHVFVDRQSQRPVAIAGEIRRALESLLGR